MPHTERIGIIIVYFKPQLEIAEKQLIALADSNLSVVIVDNSLTANDGHLVPYRDRFTRLEYIFLGHNSGIAHAQNIGIEKLARTVDSIVLLDQDSIPVAGMLETLSAEAHFLRASGVRLAAIGPTPVNRSTGRPYQARLPHRRRLFPGSDILEVEQLIASGMLISVEALRTVGGMETSLFIDGVDHEWCWRAKFRYRYRIAMSKSARLSHMLGEGDRRFLGVKLKISTPFRLYFQVRNYIVLSRRAYVPVKWKITNLIKYLIKLVYYSTVPTERREYFRNFSHGIRDGLLTFSDNRQEFASQEEDFRK